MRGPKLLIFPACGRMLNPMPVVHLTARGAERLKAGHPWVYDGDVARVVGEPGAGALVRVAGEQGAALGVGQYSPASRVRVRVFAVGAEGLPEDAAGVAALVRRRLERAVALRRALGYEEAARLVFGESDGLPGLVVDRFGAVLVVQLLSAGMEALRAEVVAALRELLAPAAIVERSDTGGREREGLAPARGLLAGALPEDGEAPFRAGGLALAADVLGGQKTGFYLDQRDSWLALRPFGAGRRILDACCYTGAFGLSLLLGGGASLLGVDSSKRAVARAAVLAERNGLAAKARFEAADAGERLAALARAGERFDFVILDPSAFARARAHRGLAEKAYAALNEAALAVVAPDGLLFTCSCTPWVGAEELGRAVAGAARRQGRGAVLLETRGQSRDHPVHPLMPETRYLTGELWHVA